jgi:hypothetical protein
MISERCGLKPITFKLRSILEDALDTVELVRMAVLSAAGHLFHGYDAAIQPLAAHVLELDGGVADVKALL